MEPENKKRLIDLRDAIQAFLNTPVHVAFVGSTKRDLAAISENILDHDYLSPDLAQQIAYLQGQRKVLESNLTLFEDTVDNLEDRIQAILDEENPIPHSTNNDETQEPLL